MTVPHEPTCSSPSPSPWPSALPALASMSVQSLRSMAESLARDTMVPHQVLRTAPTRRPRCVSVQYTLKPMLSRTQRDMEFLSRVQNYMPQIHPAIRALVYSSMRAYQPWFLCESIETTLAFDSWPTWA